MDKTITVTGSGTAYATPDAAVVNGEIVGTVADYSEAVRSSAEAPPQALSASANTNATSIGIKANLFFM